MTRDDPFIGQSEMAALMRATNWASLPIGPPASWPETLRSAVRILLTSRFAMWMAWGPELTFFYNDAYRDHTLGAKHPRALGLPAAEVWSEIWPALEPRIDVVLQRGEATWDEDLQLFLERSGYPEETFHTFSYSPLFEGDGSVGGMLCVVAEETARVIGERRVLLLHDLAARLAAVHTTADVFVALEACLAADRRAIPFSLTYLFEADGARLASSSGFAEGHPAVAPQVALESSRWPLRQVRQTGAVHTIEPLPGEGWPTGAWDIPPRYALALPIAQQGQSAPAGVFIAALNPHRPLDRTYVDFVGLFVGQIAAGLANARAHEEERRRAEALAELDRAKSAFFSNVSHELRTPLTLLLGPITDMVADPTLPPQQREQLGVVQRNARRLLKLVNTMLDFSRIEAGRAHAATVPTDLALFTADIASGFRTAIEKVGLALVVDCAPLEEPVHVDRDMWEKIVLNLLSNAFKFTFEGTIEVSLTAGDAHVRLVVKDTGTGIPVHELPYVFERFHRVEGSRGRTHEGTGIGLALVSELAKLHGGTATVESQLDRGTRFTVEIPRRGAAARPEQAQPRNASAYVEEVLRWLPVDADQGDPDGTTRQAGGSADPLVTILVADDNADMRAYVRRLLDDRWNVVTVTDGDEALRTIRSHPVDLVITDVMMPRVDGFALLDALRSEETTRELPVIMLSARAGDEARAEGVSAGADEYLVKPFSARELTARVEALLLRQRLRTVEREHARRLSRVFEHAPVGIALLRGPDHVFEVANAAYLELVAHRDVVGKPLRDALPEVTRQGLIEILDGVRATGEPFIGRSFRVELERRGVLETVVLDFVYEPVFAEHGEVEAIAVVVYDVTELAEAKHRADVASRAKDEFLAMLGHELRNPLAPILTALQVMRLRGVEGADHERAVIERQVKHVVALVDDLLDVSRITQGKIQLKRVKIELAEVVAQAIEVASPLLEQQRHRLRVEVPPQGLVVYADVARIAQVVTNLLSNAAKYTEPMGQIDVRAAREDDEVVLRVKDTGIGIDPQMLPRVFDLFAQERQALDRSQGGLGLGLAIVKSLVELHGGTVGAASAGRGHGSELEVRLPAAGAAITSSAPPSASAERAAEASGRRLLVVDDNVDAAEMLATVLEMRGFEVRIAADGPSALEVVRTFAPEAALLDIGLPIMDGYELARRLRETCAPRLALVAVTGYGQATDRQRSAAAGFDLHLVKPVDVAAIAGEIDKLLARSPP